MPNVIADEFKHSYQVFNFINDHQMLISSICITGFLIGWVRLCINRVCRQSPDVYLHGKTAILTEVSSDTGKETAKDLASRGAKIIMACKNTEAAELVADEILKEFAATISVKHLDMASFESIHKFAKEVLEEEDHIDILINNIDLKCPKGKTTDGFDMVFGTNHLGPFLLTNLLLDRIKKSAPARIINISSDAHILGSMHWDDINLDQPNAYSQWKAYCQSKLANILFTKELANRLSGTKVTTHAVHPGKVDIDVCHWDSHWVQKLVLSYLDNFTPAPVQGAQTTIYCVVDEDLIDSSGKYYKRCIDTIPTLEAMDKEAATKLWEISSKMVGFKKED